MQALFERIRSALSNSVVLARLVREYTEEPELHECADHVEKQCEDLVQLLDNHEEN